MAVNYAEKYSGKVAEYFNQSSLTASAFSGDYEFTGVRTVKVYSVETAPLGNYSVSGTARYGTPAELGDTIQELTMTQDKAFTYTIDKGSDAEQMNVKGAARSLRREVDEVINPALDKYRFGVWCRKAGTIKGLASAPTKSTIAGLIMDSSEALDDALVPQEGRTLFITSALYKELKLSTEFQSIDKLGGKALAKGVVGEIDGMAVKKVPKSWLPDGIYWLITHKSSLAAPVKLQDYKIHKDPPGINGNLVEGRVLHDAFVIGSRAAGVYAAAESAKVAATPTVAVNTEAGTFTITTATSGASVFYTLDGSDPRFSPKAKAYSGAVTYADENAASGDKIRAYCHKESAGIFASAVAEATI